MCSRYNSRVQLLSFVEIKETLREKKLTAVQSIFEKHDLLTFLPNHLTSQQRSRENTSLFYSLCIAIRRVAIMGTVQEQIFMRVWNWRMQDTVEMHSRAHIGWMLRAMHYSFHWCFKKFTEGRAEGSKSAERVEESRENFEREKESWDDLTEISHLPREQIFL